MVAKKRKDRPGMDLSASERRELQDADHGELMKSLRRGG